jgi:hypothetical protein
MLQLGVKRGGNMECNTKECIRPAKYMIIVNREAQRYCLGCITKIKNRSSASDLIENVS